MSTLPSSLVFSRRLHHKRSSQGTHNRLGHLVASLAWALNHWTGRQVRLFGSKRKDARIGCILVKLDVALHNAGLGGLGGHGDGLIAPGKVALRDGR